jgi:hypothetical protein
VVSEIPIIEHHPLLAGEDPKDGLGLLRFGRHGCFLAQGSRQVFARGGTVTTFAVGDLNHRELLGPGGAQHVLGDGASGLSLTSGQCGLDRCGGGRGAPLLHGLFDVGPTFGKRPQNGLGDVSQFTQAVVPYLPDEAERCQLGPQCGPVESSAGHLPGEEVSAIGGRPLAVGTTDQVGDNHVGMELGVAGPAGAVPECSSDEAVGLDELLPITTSAGIASLFGQVVEHGTDRPVVGGRDRVTDMFGAECPEEGDALRSGEREVVAGASFRTQLQAEAVACGGGAGQQVSESPSIDLAGKP